MGRREFQLIASRTHAALKAKKIGNYDLSELLATTVAFTHYYDHREANSVARRLLTPGETLTAYDSTSITFESSFIVDAMARTVAAEPHEHVAALNFASYKNPGGGWLNGASAQEESIARVSGLTATLYLEKVQGFYRTEKVKSPSPLHNEQLRNGVIFSHNVPIFMDDNGNVHEPYTCSIITAAAVNRNSRLVKEHIGEEEVNSIMDLRVKNVLAVAIQNNVSILLLGAWGTGVFGNPVEKIAPLFRHHLNYTFENCFKEVKFVIPDTKTMTEFKTSYEK